MIVVDWPVKVEAGFNPAKLIGKAVQGVDKAGSKEGAGLLEGCAKEEAVSFERATEEAGGKIGEEAGRSAEGARGKSRVEKIIDDGHDIIENAADVYNETSSKVITCYDCGGQGAVYYVDDYGNAETDEYGNPVLYRCPTCNGSGQLRQ